jgi:hypothetical protein
MMPELSDAVERLGNPHHPRRTVYYSDLSRQERLEIRRFCRKGLAELKMGLPRGFKGDYGWVTVMLRAVIRFGADDNPRGVWTSLASFFHRDPEQRLKASQAWLDAIEFDYEKEIRKAEQEGNARAAALMRKQVAETRVACETQIGKPLLRRATIEASLSAPALKVPEADA